LGLAWYDYIPGIGPGIAQINANAALQAMLTKNGYDSLGDFQLAHPGVCGSIVSGNPDAVAGAANIASGATDIYLNTAQVIATGGIASPGAGGPAAAKGIKGPGGKGPCKPAAPGTEPGLPSLAEAAGAAAAGQEPASGWLGAPRVWSPVHKMEYCLELLKIVRSIFSRPRPDRLKVMLISLVRVLLRPGRKVSQ